MSIAPRCSVSGQFSVDFMLNAAEDFTLSFYLPVKLLKQCQAVKLSMENTLCLFVGVCLYPTALPLSVLVPHQALTQSSEQMETRGSQIN